MKVGIDISILTRGGGVANYIGQLLSGLKKAHRNEHYNSRSRTNMKPLFTQSSLFRISLSIITIGFITLYYGAYRSFNCPWSEDLALINQFCYSFVSEFSFRVSISHFANSLAEEHFRIILILISPLYWLFKSSFTLVVLSVLSVSVTLYVILRIFETVMGDDADIRPLFLLLLLYPSTINMFLTFGGRDCVFAMMFCAFSLLFYLQNKFFPWMTACILASLCVEYTSLIVCGYAFTSFIHKKKVRWAVFAVLFGFGYFYLVNGVLMPSLRGDEMFAGIKFDEYSHIGKNPKEMLTYFFFNPVETISLLFQPQKLWFLMKLLLPLFFFPLLGIEYLLIPASQFMMVLLPQSWFYASTYWWYHTPLIPFVFTSAAIGMKRFERTSGKKIPRMAMYGMTILLLFSSGNLYFQLRTFGGYIMKMEQPLWGHINSIPQSARVCAQWPFLPQVSSRKETFPFPDLQQSDYVILGYFRNKTPSNDETYKMKVKDLLKGSDYGVVAYFDNGDIILKKGYPNIKNDDCLHFILSASSHSMPL